MRSYLAPWGVLLLYYFTNEYLYNGRITVHLLVGWEWDEIRNGWDGSHLSPSQTPTDCSRALDSWEKLYPPPPPPGKKASKLPERSKGPSFIMQQLLSWSIYTYWPFSPGRGKWGKSVWISFFWSFTVLKRLCPLQSKNTFVCPSKNFWSPVQHPCFCPIERYFGKD